jgi:hypothetical protein
MNEVNEDFAIIGNNGACMDHLRNVSAWDWKNLCQAKSEIFTIVAYTRFPQQYFDYLGLRSSEIALLRKFQLVKHVAS